MSEKSYREYETHILEKVPIHLKMVLTIREAAEYSNIGINKIYAQAAKLPICSLCRNAQARKTQSIRGIHFRQSTDLMKLL